MRASISQIKQYAYCPKLYEQEGELPADESQSKFTLLVTLMFRRDMETGAKQTSKWMIEKWQRIFFPKRREATDEELRSFNRTLPPLHKFHKWYLTQPVSTLAINYSLETNLYGHVIEAPIPVIISTGAGASLVFTEPHVSLSEMALDPAVRYVVCAIDEQLPVEKVMNVGLIDFRVFHSEVFNPTPRYIESAMIDFTNVMHAMQSGVTFPNTLGCPTCPINKTCEALKGNVGTD